MISKNDDATSSTFCWFCFASCSPTLEGSSSYPRPGGVSVINLTSGIMRLRRYVYPCTLAKADKRRVQVELPRNKDDSFSTPNIRMSEPSLINSDDRLTCACNFTVQQSLDEVHERLAGVENIQQNRYDDIKLRWWTSLAYGQYKTQLSYFVSVPFQKAEDSPLTSGPLTNFIGLLIKKRVHCVD